MLLCNGREGECTDTKYVLKIHLHVWHSLVPDLTHITEISQRTQEYINAGMYNMTEWELVNEQVVLAVQKWNNVETIHQQLLRAITVIQKRYTVKEKSKIKKKHQKFEVSGHKKLDKDEH